MKNAASLCFGTGLTLVSILVSSAVSAQTNGNGNGFGGLHFSDLTGHIAFRYVLNEQGTAQSGVATTEESRPSYEEELFLGTRGYIFHPNLLKFDIGGGVLGVQSEYNTLTEDEEFNDRVYNFISRLNILEQKPYPLLLFYEHLNPSVTAGIGQSFIQQNERYGFDFSLREPFSPVSTNISASRLLSEGEGFDIVVDDTTDQASLRMQKHFAGGGYIQYSDNWTRHESSSGNPDLPIIEHITENNTHSLGARALFGEANKGQFNITGSYSVQNQEIEMAEVPVRRYRNAAPGLSWRHSDLWRSFMNYSVNETSEFNIDTRVQSGKLGSARNTSDGVNAAFDIHGDMEETVGFMRTSSGAALTLGYHYPFSWGKFMISAGGQYDSKDQEAEQANIAVFDEEIVIDDINWSGFGHAFVDTLAPITVTTQTLQPLTDGVDYELQTIGSRTYIRRLPTSVLTSNGDTVLVDYSYLTGGTLKYDETRATYQASLDISRYLNFYVRQYRVNQNMQDDTTSIIFNNIVENSYGASFNAVFWQSWLLGAGADLVEHEEDIASYDSEHYQSYLQMPFPLYSSFRVTGKRNKVDNLGTDIDVDISGYSFLLNSRPWLRAQINVESSYEEDTGTDVLRRRWSRVLNFSWQIRRLSVSVEGRYSRERQGDYERDNTSVRAQIRRDI